MKIDNAWLHRFAILVAFCAVITIVVGAVITSLERPIAATPGAQTLAAAATFEFWHLIAGSVVAVLMLGLAVGLAAAKADKLVVQVAWAGLAVGVLDGLLGAKAVTQAVPELSDRLLSARMKELEARGIVQRTVHAGPPVRVEYSLSQMGRELGPTLSELQEWAQRWLARHTSA